MTNNETMELILAGTIEMGMIIGFVCWLISYGQEIKNNELKTRKQLQLLDTKILEVKNRIRR